MKKSIIKHLWCCLVLLFLSINLSAQKNMSEQDTIFWKENFTIIWDEDVVIEANQVLVIKPGVKLKMDGPYSVIVYGEVLALGKAENPIKLKPLYNHGWGWADTATVTGGWGGFRFMDGAGKRSEFHHCIFTHGKNNVPGSTYLISPDGNDIDPMNAGGVVYAQNYGTILFENCQFKNNMARSAGGVLFAKDVDTIQFHNCFFDGNQVLHEGGCIWSFNYEYLNVSHCTFTNNLALYGTGIEVSDKNEKGDFSDNNRAIGGTGAAINCRSQKTTSCSAIIENSRFHNNISFFSVALAYSDHVVYANNLATNNSCAPLQAYGLSGGWAHIYNNTFAYNLCFNMRAAELNGNFIFQNNIAWKNHCTCTEAPRYPQVRIYDEYQDWQFANNVIWEGRYEKGIDIITDDPLFVNPASVAGNYANGLLYDWRLRDNSPAINAGSTQTYHSFELPEFDFEGNPRIVGTSVDIGCYENQNIVGINENKQTDVATIYPNPFRDEISIQLNNNETTAWINVYNTTGTLVARQQITAESNKITLQNIPSGLYFLTIETANGNRTTTKIVKE